MPWLRVGCASRGSKPPPGNGPVDLPPRFAVSAGSHPGRAALGPNERWTMLLLSCIRLDRLRRWRRWVLAAAGSAAVLATVGCGSSDPDPDLLVRPPSSAEALAPAIATSSAVSASTEALDPAGDGPAVVAPPTTEPVESPPATDMPVPSTLAAAAPVILEPELAEEPLSESDSASKPEPEPVSLPEVGAVPEPTEAVVTAAPDDHEHPAPEPDPTPSLPAPVGEPIPLIENTEETFIDSSGWVEARYRPIEIEVGTQVTPTKWEAPSIVTRPPVDLGHAGLWDIYHCQVHEAYGGSPGTGWEFVTYAYRDEDGRFRLVVGSARPVGPCGP